MVHVLSLFWSWINAWCKTRKIRAGSEWSAQASKHQANIHMHGCNEVTLVWGSLRLTPIIAVAKLCIYLLSSFLQYPPIFSVSDFPSFIISLYNILDKSFSLCMRFVGWIGLVRVSSVVLPCFVVLYVTGKDWLDAQILVCLSVLMVPGVWFEHCCPSVCLCVCSAIIVTSVAWSLRWYFLVNVTSPGLGESFAMSSFSHWSDSAFAVTMTMGGPWFFCGSELITRWWFGIWK